MSLQRSYGHSQLTATSIETLNHLFSAVPPEELRENLIELYHTYLIHAGGKMPMSFDSISRNMYHVIHCLGDVELEARSRELGAGS